MMDVQQALDVLRDQLLFRYSILALDAPSRTQAQYFRTPFNKVFGVIVGDLSSGRFERKTVDLLLEPVILPPALAQHCIMTEAPYRGSSTEQRTKGIFLKHAQTRVRVNSAQTLADLVAWYAGLGGQAAVTQIAQPGAALSGVAPVPVPAVLVADAPDKGLLIRDPWIEQILSGEKVWEMRSRATQQRGWVALIRSGSGMVFGVARIVDSIGPLTEAQMLASQDKHGIPPRSVQLVPAYRHAWVLADVKRLAKPVPYRHRPGALIFAKLDLDVRRQIAAQLE